MMWWKKKKAMFRQVQQQLSSRFLEKSTKLQLRCAAYLRRQDAKLTPGQRKICLVLFMSMFGGASAGVLATTFWGESQPTLRVDPVYRAVTALPRTQAPRLNAADSTAIFRFRHMLDSLQQTPRGRMQLDSFRRRRPGFIDSFIQLEKLFRTDQN